MQNLVARTVILERILRLRSYRTCVFNPWCRDHFRSRCAFATCDSRRRGSSFPLLAHRQLPGRCDQRLWPDRDDASVQRSADQTIVGTGNSPDWSSDLEHAGLCFGRWFGACAGGGCGGALHCGGGTGAGLSEAARADGGAVRGRSVWSGGEPDVPHRGPGALAPGRGSGLPRAGRPAR